MAQRATSLGPKPSLFSFCFFGFCFFSLLSFLCFFNRQKTCFPPRKGHFWFIFNVSLSFSLNLFGLPLFLFLFLCLSRSLVFLSSFMSFCFLFVSCFCLFFIFLSSLLLFHEKNTWTFSIAISFFPEIFSLSFGFLSCFFFPIPFSYLCFFLILSYVFCSTSMFLVSKKQSWETPISGQKGSCNKTGFFMNLCFGKFEKLSFFCPFFLPNFGWCSKNTIKIGISAHF